MTEDWKARAERAEARVDELLGKLDDAWKEKPRAEARVAEWKNAHDGLLAENSMQAARVREVEAEREEFVKACDVYRARIAELACDKAEADLARAEMFKEQYHEQWMLADADLARARGLLERGASALEARESLQSWTKDARAFLAGTGDAPPAVAFVDRCEHGNALPWCATCSTARPAAPSRECTCLASDWGPGVTGVQKMKASLAVGIHAPDCPARTISAAPAPPVRR
jgi:hypothetical protein